MNPIVAYITIGFLVLLVIGLTALIFVQNTAHARDVAIWEEKYLDLRDAYASCYDQYTDLLTSQAESLDKHSKVIDDILNNSKKLEKIILDQDLEIDKLKTKLFEKETNNE